MLTDLLARRQLRSLYQPLVHRASGDLIGYEALARRSRHLKVLYEVTETAS